MALPLQYSQLQQLQDRFQSNLVVIATPSDSFANQEYQTNKQVESFCHNLHLSLVVTEKLSVRGSNIDPLYKYINNQAGYFAIARWNFYKYLFSREGHFLNWYSPLTAPCSKKIVHFIKSH